MFGMCHKAMFFLQLSPPIETSSFQHLLQAGLQALQVSNIEIFRLYKEFNILEKSRKCRAHLEPLVWKGQKNRTLAKNNSTTEPLETVCFRVLLTTFFLIATVQKKLVEVVTSIQWTCRPQWVNWFFGPSSACRRRPQWVLVGIHKRTGEGPWMYFHFFTRVWCTAKSLI